MLRALLDAAARCNWKTTLSGVLAALFGFVVFSPQWFPPILVDIAKYACLGGLAALGITARDVKRPS